MPHQRFLKLDTERQGEILVGSGALLWAIFPIVLVSIPINLLPLFSASLSTLSVAFFMGILSFFKGGFGWVGDKSIWGPLIGVIFFIGLGVYGLLFLAARYTDANTLALVGLVEVLFSFLLFGILGFEKYEKIAFLGGGFILIGAFLLLYQDNLNLNFGAFLGFLAYACAPFGNLFQRKLRQKMNAIQMMFARSLGAGMGLLGLSFLFEEPSFKSLQFENITYILFLGIVFMGIQKIIWIEAIHRISVTKANLLSVFEPVMTMILVFILWQNFPSYNQILALIPMLIGAIIILKSKSAFQIQKI